MPLRKLLHNAETMVTNSTRNLNAVKTEITDRAMFLVNEYPHSIKGILLDKSRKRSVTIESTPNKRNTELVEVWVVVHESGKIVVGDCKYIAVKNLTSEQQLLIIEHIQNKLKIKQI